MTFYSDFRLIFPKEYHFWVKIAEKVLTSAKKSTYGQFFDQNLKFTTIDRYMPSFNKKKHFWSFEGQFLNLDTQNNDMKIIRLEYS